MSSSAPAVLRRRESASAMAKKAEAKPKQIKVNVEKALETKGSKVA